MNDNTPIPAVKAAPRAFGYKALLLLLITGAAAFGAWRLVAWQMQRTQDVDAALAALKTGTAQLQAGQDEALDAARQSNLAIANFDSRLDGYDEAVGKLTEQLQGGRVRFQLAAVENLLLAANERVQLQRDARGAVAALELADQRLAALSEPRLFKLREAISQERGALLAVQQPDMTSAALTFSSLIARVPQLPLRARVPDHFEARHAPAPKLAADAGWADRAWASAKQALESVFSVRRNNGPAPRLLPPDEEALVYQVLALKLEGARVAMLREDAASYRDLCDASARWLNDYFREGDPNVLAARAELERLKGIKLDQPLPDVSRSLALLRGFLDTAPQ